VGRLGRYSAGGTAFYRIGDREGPYTSLGAARSARTQMYGHLHPSKFPKIQKLEAFHGRSGHGVCYAVLDWIDVDE